jgi:hypothetical protein
MFIAECSPNGNGMFTSCFGMFKECSRNVPRMLMEFSRNIYGIFPECTPKVHGMIAECSPDVHQMFTKCSLGVQWILSESVHQIFAERSLLNIYRIYVKVWNVHWMSTGMLTECPLNVHWMFSECSLNIHWVFTEGCRSPNVEWMFAD